MQMFYCDLCGKQLHDNNEFSDLNIKGDCKQYGDSSAHIVIDTTFQICRDCTHKYRNEFLEKRKKIIEQRS